MSTQIDTEYQVEIKGRSEGEARRALLRASGNSKETMMNRNRTQLACTAWALGLLCVACLTVSIGCTQQNSRGRATAAADQQQPRGALGVELRTDQTSLTITDVEAGSPAEKAGLKAGDKLISVNDRAIKTASGLQSQIKTAAKESGELAIKVRRNGSEHTVQADVTSEETPPSKPLLTGQQSTGSPDGNKLAEAEQLAEGAERQPSSPEPDSEAVSEDVATAERAASDETSELPKESGSGRQVVGYRGTQGERKEAAEAAEPTAKETDEGVPAEEDDAADLRPQLAAKPAERADGAIQQPSLANGEKSTENATASGDQREVTLQDVEKKLEEVKETLDGFISQRKKVEFQQEMDRQLREFDDRVATLEHDVKQLREQLSDKQKHLDDVRKKREEFAAEELDPQQPPGSTSGSR